MSLSNLATHLDELHVLDISLFILAHDVPSELGSTIDNLILVFALLFIYLLLKLVPSKIFIEKRKARLVH